MSSSPIDDGGPAFPRPGTDCGPDNDGMSLRAYFAGQALGGLARGFLQPADIVFNAVGVAEDCIKIADAMIAELNRTSEKS